MGYSTDYELSIVDAGDPEVNTDKAVSVLSEISDYDWEGSPSLEGVKWYNHPRDMRELSSRFPNAVFLLNGAGEESGDVWKKYYKNGKEQVVRAELTFDPYDESKLR